jgi:hypothetical protein
VLSLGREVGVRAVHQIHWRILETARIAPAPTGQANNSSRRDGILENRHFSFLFVHQADEVASLPSCSTNEGQTCDLQHPRAREYLWQAAQKLMAQEPECR